MSVTLKQVQAWRELAEAATPGPWRHLHGDSPEGCPHGELEPNGCWEGVYDTNEMNVEDSSGNCAFIAAARTAVPALCAALDEARAEVERLRGAAEAPGRWLLSRLTAAEKERDALRSRMGDCLDYLADAGAPQWVRDAVAAAITGDARPELRSGEP